jgi:hypothetical protein
MAYTFNCNFTLDLYLSTLLVNSFKKIPSCKNQVTIICVVFNLVCSWTLVENIVAKGGFSTSALGISLPKWMARKKLGSLRCFLAQVTNIRKHIMVIKHFLIQAIGMKKCLAATKHFLV